MDLRKGICALGTMLDSQVLKSDGSVNPTKLNAVLKTTLVEYAVYLHLKGNLFVDKKMTTDQLVKHFSRKTKTKIVSELNTRLRNLVNTHVVVRGTSTQHVDVFVKKM
jgi:hypothetical protein